MEPTFEHVLALVIHDDSARFQVLVAQEVGQGDSHRVGWPRGDLLHASTWRCTGLRSLRRSLTGLATLLALGLLLLHALLHGSSLCILNALDDGLDRHAFFGSLLSNPGVELGFLLHVECLDLFHLLGSRLLAWLDLHAWGQRNAHRHALTWARATHGHAASGWDGAHCEVVV